MCAGSDAKLNGIGVSLYMGYYGGRITIGDNAFEKADYKGHREDSLSPDEMVKFLSTFSASKLAQLIVDLVENSDEG